MLQFILYPPFLDRSGPSMNFATFKRSVDSEDPPVDISAAALGLWWDAKGHWDKAHDAAQKCEDGSGSWVHAYLHRKEGDLENASYWYRRAGRTMPDIRLSKEWELIVISLLEETTADKRPKKR